MKDLQGKYSCKEFKNNIDYVLGYFIHKKKNECVRDLLFVYNKTKKKKTKQTSK